MSCEPQDLVTAARCFNCKWGSADAIQIYLLCTIANGGIAPEENTYVIGAEGGGVIGPEGGGMLGVE